jgi:hypothetical protein
MYPYPVHHPYDQYSMVDLDAVDAEEWPGFGGVRGSVCIMEPGDLLFVPQFWCAAAQHPQRLVLAFDACAPLSEALQTQLMDVQVCACAVPGSGQHRPHLLSASRFVVHQVLLRHCNAQSCLGSARTAACYVADTLHLSSAGARIRSPECLPLQVSRLLEERVADAEKIRDVRHWLSLIGALQIM